MKKEQVMAYVKRNKVLLAITSAAAVVLVSFGAYALLPVHPAESGAANRPHYEAPDRAAPNPPPRMMENGTPFSFADLVERVSPAVVSIITEQRVSNPGGGPGPIDKYNGRGGPPMRPPEGEPMAMGSGFIIDPGGLIVTNNHVIDGAGVIKVKLPDGHTYEARLVGTDPATDVALLRITVDHPLPTVEFGNDRALRVGDWVVAVGNPFGLSNTVTAGIVSSIGRDLGSVDQPYTDFIQIDAPINRGNSGGPTFDLHGQVIGMNSMIFSPTGTSIGIGFAIPASTIKEVVAALLAHGRVARGWLGVQIQPVTPELATSMGMADPKGALIASVVPDSPAAHAGLRQGDVIVAINGSNVADAHEVTRRVASLQAGATAAFTILRGGQRQSLSVTIGTRRDAQVASSPDQPQQGGPPPGKGGGLAPSAGAAGMGLADLTPPIRRSLRINDNVQGAAVVQVEPNSPAAAQGIHAGDVIVAVQTRSVHNAQEATRLIFQAQASGAHAVTVAVLSEGTRRVVVLALRR